VKPVPFDYVRPASLAAAATLAANPDTMVLAGGQSLIPLLAMRHARPACLVDISRITELAGIAQDGERLIIGAMTRQAEAERSPLVAQHAPLLAAALPWVGLAPIRARGTIGGSMAYADPSAEIPLVAVTLGGTVKLSSWNGTRAVQARDFLAGAMITTRQPGEILSALELTVWTTPFVGAGFHEIAERRYGVAIVAAAAQVSVDQDGICTACAAGLGGPTESPVRLEEIETALVGTALPDSLIEQTVQSAVDKLSARTDPRATTGYRKRAAARLLAKALATARGNALGPLGGE
jgi:CO/xanthine dehydrogenase FAD-binding subunit